MAVKDISDEQVCRAYRDAREGGFSRWPYDLLEEWTGQPMKVCYRAMERAYRHELVEVGVSLRAAWLTDAGKALLEGS